MILREGTKLGEYEVKKLIGSGGMGEVYRAHDLPLGRDVAIKVLPRLVSNDPERLRRFEQEARAAAALNHPNILAVYQLGAYEGSPYLVSELLEGDTLREHLRRGRMAVRKVVELGVQIARGLAAAHEKGIIHRDLKPENLFVTKSGQAKILDFGLAKLNQVQATSENSAPTLAGETEPGVVMGTVGYMAPEQVRGQKSDHRADIFAFGTVLYEMLAGKRAFQKATSVETMNAILHEDPPEFSEAGAIPPPALLRVVRRCLEKNPDERFQSASDLAFALDALSDSGAESVGGSTGSKSRSSWAWATAIMSVAAVAVLIWWSMVPSGDPIVEAVTQLTDDGQAKAKFGWLLTDGSRIYFGEGQTGHWRLAQVSRTGGQTAPISTRVRDPQLMSLAPDSSGLLVGEIASATDMPLWLVPLPAGESRRLGDIMASEASFLPGGTHMVYASGTTIYLSDRSGGNARKVVEVQTSPEWLSVSPDGLRIRFTLVADDLSHTLWEVGVDGSSLRQMLKGWQDPPEECCGRWTADGRFYVFQSLRQGRWDLWALKEGTTFWRRRREDPVRLTNGPLSYLLPLPSVDGKEVYAIGSKDRGEIVKYDLTKKQLVPLLNGVSAIDAEFSRDGQWVVYVSYPDHSLWRSRADGSERVQLTYPPEVAALPHISPDNSRVAFGTWGGRQHVYILSMQGEARQLIADDANAPTWSPDGNTLVFEQIIPGSHFRGGSKTWELHTYDLNTGKSSVVPGSQGKFGPWWPTPDRLVAAAEDASSLVTYDFKSKKWSDLAKGIFVNWYPTADGKYLYCEKAESAGPIVERIHLSDGQVDELMNLSGLRRAEDEYFGTWLGVAPDGSPVLTRDIGTQEIYSLTTKWH